MNKKVNVVDEMNKVMHDLGIERDWFIMNVDDANIMMEEVTGINLNLLTKVKEWEDALNEFKKHIYQYVVYWDEKANLNKMMSQKNELTYMSKYGNILH